MSITDELRKYATNDKLHYLSDYLAIADRIDAEHESACAEAYGNGVMSVPIALDENAWVELPKDADGEYIHFGDVLDQFGTPMTVLAMSDPDPDQGDCMLKLTTDGISDVTWVRARKIRHYHAPTVEDVLREFANEVYADADNEIRDRDFLCAKYAKRLTLAEGEDA